MTDTYRVDWAEPDVDGNPTDDIQVKFYETNRDAAMSFARRKSIKPDAPTIYVIKRTDDRDVGQYLFDNGLTNGFEQA